MPLRIVFAGTPDFAAHHLQCLIDSEHDIVGVYSQPDRPANRGKSLQASPVKQLAIQHALPVFQPINFKEHCEQQTLADLNADLMVVVAYGLLLPQVILDTPKFGCINVHASLLPRWRGAAPIQRCIEAGDTQTGVTIMQMDAGLDTGDMLVIKPCSINADESGGSLHDKLLGIGGPALLCALTQIEQGTTQPEVQPTDGVCYAHKFNKADAAIDWNRDADSLSRLVRTYNPFPVAHCGYSEKGKEQRLRVWEAKPTKSSSPSPFTPGQVISFDAEGLNIACASNSSLLITKLQLPGKKPMSVKDLLNGRADLFLAGQNLA